MRELKKFESFLVYSEPVNFSPIVIWSSACRNFRRYVDFSSYFPRWKRTVDASMLSLSVESHSFLAYPLAIETGCVTLALRPSGLEPSWRRPYTGLRYHVYYMFG
jgi:hypothetical protein